MAIGRPRGGMTSKFLAVGDAFGNLVGFELLPSQRHDTMDVAALIEGRGVDRLIADTTLDVNWIVDEMELRQAEIVFTQHANRKTPR